MLPQKGMDFLQVLWYICKLCVDVSEECNDSLCPKGAGSRQARLEFFAALSTTGSEANPVLVPPQCPISLRRG